jgi:hypothetical protein
VTAASDHLVALFADTGAECARVDLFDVAIRDLVAQLAGTVTDERRRRYVVGAARVAQIEFAGLEERLIGAVGGRINDTPRPKVPAPPPPPPEPNDPPPPPPADPGEQR